MMTPFFIGMFVGLFLALLMGPVFFKLVQTSMNHGFKNGVRFALGISFSDSIYALLAYLGLASIIQKPEILFWLGKAGGTVLVLFGVSSIISAIRGHEMIKERRNRFFKDNFFLQGLTINILSPAVIFYWMGIVTVGKVRFDIPESQIHLYLIGILSTILTFDFLKSYLAHRLKSILTAKFVRNLNFIVGALLIFFGITLFFQVGELSEPEILKNI
jgi:threonine/homoserine/homoserine lactone efflux protein